MSPSKKSIGIRMKSQILHFILFAIFITSVYSADSDISCANVTNIFKKSKMLTAVDIQEQPNSDVGQLCLNRGCCAASAKSQLLQQARSQLESALRSELIKLSDILANRAKRFDEFFRKLLQLSRDEFHAMFKRTYGMIYEQHSYVFEQLFEELERYYMRGDTNFENMMDRFFGILYEKMFIVLNSQYTFDEKYLKCVKEHMSETQPFEDVPRKLSVQLRRAFVATRTFHKALRAGAEVVRNMTQVGVTEECVTAWARLRFCSACGGQELPACSRYCHNVLRGCLPAHADLAANWDAYVDAVEKVADRLLGPFNIAVVVEPIDIKISEAIMSFQEHNQEISQKIFASCGKPVLGGQGGAVPFLPSDRTRRYVRSIPDFDWTQKGNDVDDFELEASFESLLNDDPSLLSLRTPEGIRKVTEEMAEQARSREKFLQYMRGNIDLKEYEEHERKRREAEPEPAIDGGSEIDYKSYEFYGKKGSKKKPTTSKADVGYEQLVRETRDRVKSSRLYWNQLPVRLCTSVSVTTSPCFNGSHDASYTGRAAGEGSVALASNPEVRCNWTGAVEGSDAVRVQQDALRTLTAKLKDAYNGAEVKWTDEDPIDISPYSFADRIDGLGSGSGSGDDTDDTEDLPDDDEDRADYGEGSGDNPPEDVDETAITPERENVPSTSEPPFEPNVIDTPGSKNVRIRGRMGEVPPIETDDVEPRIDIPAEKPEVQSTPVKETPVPGSADRPSLQKALFTYALPVVCAWFGTMVTDLF